MLRVWYYACGIFCYIMVYSVILCYGCASRLRMWQYAAGKVVGCGCASILRVWQYAVYVVVCCGCGSRLWVGEAAGVLVCCGCGNMLCMW